jgi:pilus assembly protein CpaE
MSMGQMLSVVIIDGDGESRLLTETTLRNLGHITLDGSVADLQSGYRIIQQVKPQLVILSLDPALDEAIALTEKIGQSYPGMDIFVSSSNKQPDVILQAMRAGAKEFLVRPIHAEELTTAVQKAGRQWLARQAESANPGKIISVFCTKGGYGATTVAVNLATSLAPLQNQPVVLVDLDLAAGDVCTFLGVTPKYTIAHVTSNLPRMDQTYLQSVLTRHVSGIYVLGEPALLEESEAITPAQIRETLTLLRGITGVTIVDVKKTFDDRSLMALDLSDIIILVTVLSVPAIRNTQRTLEVFQRLGYSRDKVKLVVNRYLPNAEIKIEDVEKTLNYPVSWQIPNDFFAAMSSINRGQPISKVAPNSELNISIKQLARDIGGLVGVRVAPEKTAKAGLLGKLFKSG